MTGAMTASHLRISLFALWALAFVPTAASAASFHHAPLPKELRPFYTKPVQFGYLTVPENRARPNGRTLRIAAVIMKATHPTPGAAPVFYLNGGPGGSCTAFGEIYTVFAAIQRHRDVVLIDQRGVGFSEPYLGYTAANAREIRAARDGFRARGIDLSAYNTTENAADIDALRIALGHPQVIIFGNSYGSILAQEVMRSFPGSVACAILNGVDPAETNFVVEANRNGRHGLGELFRDVQRTPSARRAFPRLARTYFTLLRRLERRPIRIDGIVITSGTVQGLVLGYLQTPQRIRLIPLLITQIAREKSSPWLRKQFTPTGPPIPRSFSSGMYNSIVGTQYASPGWVAQTREADATLGPRVFRESNSLAIMGLIRGVDIWGVPYHPRATRDPLVSNIRTLVLDGQMEAQTPFHGGATVASRLSRSYLLTFPRSGHGTGFTSGPAMQAILQFIADPTRRPTCSLAALTRRDFYLTRVPGTSASSRRAQELPDPEEDVFLPIP